MSRLGDDYDPSFPNEGAFWEHRTHMALRGKKGRKALAELRDALLALPERRLIEHALSTVGKDPGPPTAEEVERGYRDWEKDTAHDLVKSQGEGMCSVAAYAWHKRVQAGEDPDEVMRDLPLAPPDDGGDMTTLDVGMKAGLNQHVAWHLMNINDERYKGLTPEQRWNAVMAWIDKQLALPPLTAARRR